MSGFKIDPKLLEKADKILRKRCEKMNAMVTDIGQQMMQDQAEWLDGVFKDLLPPDLYDAGKKLERQDEIKAYAEKHGIQVIFIPDSLAVRVTLHGKPHAQFVPRLTVDGEPVTMTPQNNLDESRN